jgi:hypothetical protein
MMVKAPNTQRSTRGSQLIVVVMEDPFGRLKLFGERGDIACDIEQMPQAEARQARLFVENGREERASRLWPQHDRLCPSAGPDGDRTRNPGAQNPIAKVDRLTAHHVTFIEFRCTNIDDQYTFIDKQQ